MPACDKTTNLWPNLRLIDLFFVDMTYAAHEVSGKEAVFRKEHKMNKFLGLGAVLALLAACDERPANAVVDPDVPVDPDNPPVLEGNVVLDGDLDSAAYNGSDELTIQITLDGGVGQLQEYVSAGTLNGYNAFTFQDGTDSRFFRAFALESSDGELQGVVVSDGGQFNRFFGGGAIIQGDYTAPTSGLSRYSGTYVGLVNFGPDAPGASPPPGSVNGVPRVSDAVEGQIFILADFNAPASLNGEIFNRTLDNFGPLPEVVLTATDIADDGSFSGTAELGDLTPLGGYSGVFSGTDASSVGGIVELGAGFLGLQPLFDGEGNPVIDFETGEQVLVPIGDGNEVEFGIFVLDEVSP